jgi:pimeloyl-ACP methyl ester carboxylesterase
VPFCSSGGAKIHYEVSGEGEPLVLIAGTGFDLSFWDDLLPSLVGYRVLRLDNRGAGLSDLPDGELTIQLMADDVVAVMDEVGMDVAHVHGASMGGLIAQDLAIRHGERVVSLVLGATWAGSAPMSGAIRALPLLLSRKEPEELLRASAPYLSSEPLADDGSPFPGHALASRRSTMLHRQLGAQLRYSSLRRLRRIQTPTLVLHGANDRLISPWNARLLARRIPGARLRLISGAGHLYHRDRPDEAREELLSFLLDAAAQLLDQRDLDIPGDHASREVAGTVLFTDIVGSTAQAARLGDRGWHELLRRHDAITQRAVDEHGGIRIKGTGDGVLVLFDDAGAAARCALAMQAGLAALDLTIRAGLHSGTFLVAGDDLHGLALHVAARVMASASDGGVRLSDASHAALPDDRFRTAPVGELALRGLPGSWTLHELLSAS